MTPTERIADPWGGRTPYGAGDSWPARPDEQLADGVAAADVERWVQSASLLHSNGDAMDIAVIGDRIVDLLALASSCHPQTLRQIRWANTMIKTLSPQVLSNL